MPARPIIALKALHQLGPLPLALNALYRLGLRTGHYKREEKKQLEHQGPARLKALFALPDRDAILQVLGEKGKLQLLSEADEITGGQVRLFGGDPVPLQLTFHQPLCHWTEYEIHPELLSPFYTGIPDIKFIWEPARFGWAFTLGRAYYLTQDDRYAAAFWRYFEEFTEGNPPYLGPHWMNGQEVAIRLLALVWTAQVLESAPASSPARRAAIAQSVELHARRIPSTLIYARSQNNNHLVTEAAGLYTAGLALEISEWRDLGWRWLNWSFQHQISSYGEYIQHSTNYQRVMLQAALWANAVKDVPWPFATRQALGRATHFLFSILDPVSGWTPNLGANDGARILPLSGLRFEDFRPTIQATARAFLQTQMPSGLWDETALWLGIPLAATTYQPEHYLNDNVRGHNSWAYLRASSFRSRLGHMDQLHLDLWWRGLNVAQDAGTYLYNGVFPWDNPLARTRVHNTITVDGREQMTRGGRFLMLDWFPAYSKASVESDADVIQKVVAHHQGYRGIRHERSVTVYTADRWLIQDSLSSRGDALHSYRLHWLFPDWEWRMEKEQEIIAAKIKSPYGWIDISFGATIPTSEVEISVARAGEVLYGPGNILPFEGWASRAYGVKIPALSVALQVQAGRSATFTTEFGFPA